MDNDSRLFDIVHSQRMADSMRIAYAKKDPKKPGNNWVNYSLHETVGVIDRISLGLIKLGIKKGDNIALISNNRPEWNFVDFGIQQVGAVVVPIYPSISYNELKYIFNDSEVKLCFVDNAELAKKIKSITAETPSLTHVYSFDKNTVAEYWGKVVAETKIGELTIVEQHKDRVNPNDLATIIYTSGTTGTPKGVMLSHFNIASNIVALSKILPFINGNKALSFLPLSHVFERTISYAYMANGVSIYYAENLETIVENLKEVGPDYFTTVPRLLEKVYEKIIEKGNSLEGLKRNLFFWAIDLGKKFELNQNMGIWYNLQLKLARKYVFSKWHSALGGNIQAIVSGAAALQPQLARIFAAAEIPIIEGYGLTETSPVLCSNRLEIKERRIGTVGSALPGVEIKIAVDGEILAKGPNIMVGYYKREDLTNEVFDSEGWFHTGDIGEFAENRFLKIIDRKKELFKTSGGKYVAPQQVENKYKESLFIEQIMVVGENKKFVGALIVPSIINLTSWCMKKDLHFDNTEAMLREDIIKDKIQREIEAINSQISHVEQVKSFILLSKEWTASDGELTPTAKLKRRVIQERFALDIESLYSES
ncbi:MAG TPA: long-chain fatty acid--CoA ligase [Flavobacteriales bacterium]|nr:long-chain fatty acid--CoA ligase [Flavobacteriales bacterium]